MIVPHKAWQFDFKCRKPNSNIIGMQLYFLLALLITKGLPNVSQPTLLQWLHTQETEPRPPRKWIMFNCKHKIIQKFWVSKLEVLKVTEKIRRMIREERGPLAHWVPSLLSFKKISTVQHTKSWEFCWHSPGFSKSSTLNSSNPSQKLEIWNTLQLKINGLMTTKLNIIERWSQVF